MIEREEELSIKRKQMQDRTPKIATFDHEYQKKHRDQDALSALKLSILTRLRSGAPVKRSDFDKFNTDGGNYSIEQTQELLNEAISDLRDLGVIETMATSVDVIITKAKML